MYETDKGPAGADAPPPLATPAERPPFRELAFALASGTADWTLELVEEPSSEVALSFGQRVGARPARFVTLRSTAETYEGEEFALGETLFGYTFRAEVASQEHPGAARVWARISVIGPVTRTERGLSCGVSARVTLSLQPPAGSAQVDATVHLGLPGRLIVHPSPS